MSLRRINGQRVLFTTSILAFLSASLFSLINSFFYPEAVFHNFKFDSKMLVFILGSLSLIPPLLGVSPFPDWFVRLNRKLFPILLILSLIFIFANYAIHLTFSLNTFHVHAEEFPVLVLISGIVVYTSQARQYKENYHWIVYLFAPLVLIFLSSLRFSLPNLYAGITKEDSLFENLQFLLYLTGAIFALGASVKSFSKDKVIFLISLLLFVFLAFVAFEEISWGQRIFGINTPDFIAENNTQDELTLHNYQPVQHLLHYVYMAIGLYGVFGRKVINKIRLISSKYHNYLSPGRHLIIYFFTIFMFYFLNDFLVFYYEMGTLERNSFSFWQETAELILAIGFLFFAYEVYTQSRKERI